MKHMHKFGIQISTSMEHVLQLNKENDNRFWRDATDKEMGAVDPSFTDLEEG